MVDHDQRFKSLLKAFFAEFIQTFFPAWADRFDFTRVDWLEQEVFTDPPRGERRCLDQVARLPLRPGVPPLAPGTAASRIEPGATRGVGAGAAGGTFAAGIVPGGLSLGTVARKAAPHCGRARTCPSGDSDVAVHHPRSIRGSLTEDLHRRRRHPRGRLDLLCGPPCVERRVRPGLGLRRRRGRARLQRHLGPELRFGGVGSRPRR